jgi:ATP-dependent Clp protease adaptor protein ClpS
MTETTQVSEPSVKPVAKPQPATRNQPQQLPPYHVVLLDDNDHTYEYVIDMLCGLFNHSVEQAFAMAQQVDKAGRAIVMTTHKERAELKRDQILGYGCDIRLSRSKDSMRAVIEPAEG